MKNFDLKRFTFVLRRELTFSWKMIAVYATISILLFVFSELKIKYIDIDFRGILFYFISIGGVFVLASRVLANIWSRRRCISTFTLPASIAEIFIARYFLGVIIPMLFAFSMLIFKQMVDLAGEPSFFGWNEFWHSWGITIKLTIIGAHIAMLGGAFFNKLVFVKTAVCVFVAFLSFLYVLNKFELKLNVLEYNLDMMIIAVVVGIIVSYLRFSHRTVSQYN